MSYKSRQLQLPNRGTGSKLLRISQTAHSCARSCLSASCYLMGAELQIDKLYAYSSHLLGRFVDPRVTCILISFTLMAVTSWAAPALISVRLFAAPRVTSKHKSLALLAVTSWVGCGIDKRPLIASP